METNKIIFTKTEIIDGEVCNTNVREREIEKKFGKSYFNMCHWEKVRCEEYYCANLID
jgi:hypothetical protein